MGLFFPFFLFISFFKYQFKSVKRFYAKINKFS